jgi:hypothetical protein
MTTSEENDLTWREFALLLILAGLALCCRPFTRKQKMPGEWWENS